MPDTSPGSPASTTSYNKRSTLAPFQDWSKRFKIDNDNLADTVLWTNSPDYDPGLESDHPYETDTTVFPPRPLDIEHSTYPTTDYAWANGRPTRNLRHLRLGGDLAILDPKKFINRADYEFLRDTPLTQTEAAKIDKPPVLESQPWLKAFRYLQETVQHSEYFCKKTMQDILPNDDLVITTQDPAYKNYLKHFGRLYSLARMIGLVPYSSTIDNYILSLDAIALIDNYHRGYTKAWETIRGVLDYTWWPSWRQLTPNQIPPSKPAGHKDWQPSVKG